MPVSRGSVLCALSFSALQVPVLSGQCGLPFLVIVVCQGQMRGPMAGMVLDIEQQPAQTFLLAVTQKNLSDLAAQVGVVGGSLQPLREQRQLFPGFLSFCPGPFHLLLTLPGLGRSALACQTKVKRV